MFVPTLNPFQFPARMSLTARTSKNMAAALLVACSAAGVMARPEQVEPEALLLMIWIPAAAFVLYRRGVDRMAAAALSWRDVVSARTKLPFSVKLMACAALVMAAVAGVVGYQGLFMLPDGTIVTSKSYTAQGGRYWRSVDGGPKVEIDETEFERAGCVEAFFILQAGCTLGLLAVLLQWQLLALHESNVAIVHSPRAR